MFVLTQNQEEIVNIDKSVSIKIFQWKADGFFLRCMFPDGDEITLGEFNTLEKAKTELMNILTMNGSNGYYKMPS